MLSKENILTFLLTQDKLWQSETQHEAMRLLKTLYETSPEHRERLVDYVLIGPPLSRGKDSEDDKRYTEHKIFIILKYLQDQGLKLSYGGKKYLEKIKVKHPKWTLDRDADIENPIYPGWHKNQFTFEEIYYFFGVIIRLGFVYIRQSVLQNDQFFRNMDMFFFPINQGLFI